MPKRVLEGKVVSASNLKTVVVQVDRRYRHPLYKKTLIRSKKYSAHDEKGHFKIDDIVQIMECRPHSKTKKFEVIYN